MWMVLEFPNLMEWGADSTGFFAGFFWLPEGRIPTGESAACRRRDRLLGGCQGLMVKLQDPCGPSCDQVPAQVQEQGGGPGQVRSHLG